MSKNGLRLIFATVCISGFSVFFNQFGVKNLDADIFCFGKNVIVFVLLLSVILFAAKWPELKSLSLKNWGKLMLIGLIGGSIPFILFFNGLKFSSAVNGAFIHKTLFVYVLFFSVLFLKEKFNLKMVLAAILLLTGMAYASNLPQKFVPADLLILLATIFWAGENVLSKWVLKDLSGVIVGFGRMFFGAIFIFIYLLMTNKTGLIFSLNTNQITWIVLSALLLFFYVYTWYQGLKEIPVSLATMILSLGLPITVLLDTFYKLSLPPLPKIGGSVLIVFALCLGFCGQKVSKLGENRVR